MTFRLYLYIMGLASAAAWTAWVVVIHAIDPVHTGLLGFLLFYGTLAIALIGTLSLFGAGIRAWSFPEEHPSRHTIRSFRQSILLSGLILIILFMLSSSVLRWWSMILAVIIIGLIELIIISIQRKT